MSSNRQAYLVDLLTTFNDGSTKTVRVVIFGTFAYGVEAETAALQHFNDNYHVVQSLTKIWPNNVTATYVGHA